MTLYLDASALAKRYIEEEGREEAERILAADQEWSIGQHGYTEVRLALGRRLKDQRLAIARSGFERDWRRLAVVDVDEHLTRRAAELGEVTNARTLDALHLAAAERAGGRAFPIVTFDIRLATAARTLGFTVLGS